MQVPSDIVFAFYLGGTAKDHHFFFDIEFIYLIYSKFSK